MSVPSARVRPDGLGEHVEVIVARSKHRAQAITTNRITRSAWFVGAIGALLLSPFVIFAVWGIYEVMTTPWFSF